MRVNYFNEFRKIETVSGNEIRCLLEDAILIYLVKMHSKEIKE